MKTISRAQHPFNFRSGATGIICFALALETALLTSGCHQKPAAEAPKTVSAETARDTNVVPPPAPASPLHAPVAQALPPNGPAIAASASTEAVTAQLTLELRRYVAYTRTIPKSFEDFVARDPVRFPPPPAGKKYVIAGAQVVLR